MTARKIFGVLSGIAFGGLLVPQAAQALPAFAAQTGQTCTACHIGGFGPQLTPLGRAFKIGGYTQTGGDGLRATIPLSAMALGSFTNTASAVPADQVATGYRANNNLNLDQASLFIAGNIGDHSGAMMQITGGNNFAAWKLDNSDIRPFTTAFDVGDKELRIGFTLNNNPTVQDPYNSTYAWGYPYVAPGLAPTPAGQTMLAGALSTNSIGYTGYLWWDKSLYLEAGVYQTQSPWLLKAGGNDFSIGSTAGAAPYLRAAYEWNWGDNSAHAGALFMQSNVSPVSGVRQTDPSFGHDTYTDTSLDAGYQYLGNGTHIFTVDAIYTHEQQALNGSAAAFNAANATSFGSKYSLDQFRINGSYWYNNTYGLTLNYQRVWGSANPVLYAPGEFTGSAASRPGTDAYVVEVDWVPFGKDDSWAAPLANLKLGVQYIGYVRYNGGTAAYDGVTGRSASNNNTVYAFAWLAF